MSVIYLGPTAFEQSGVPQWTFGGFDLDTFTVPFTGARPELDAFLAQYTPWQVSAIDSGMFLTRYAVDQNRVYPTVQLLYAGKRGGILTEGKHEFDDQIASASRTIGGTITFSIQYYGPTNVLSWISRKPGELGPSGDVTAPTTPIRMIQMTEDAGSVSLPIGSGVLGDTIIQLYFQQTLVKTSRAEEVVAGQYWHNTNRISKVLLPKSTGTIDGNMHVSFTIEFDITEVVAGGRGADFLQLTDGSNVVLGFYLEEAVFKAYTEIGGVQTVEIPASTPIANSPHLVSATLSPLGGGNWSAQVNIDGADLPLISVSGSTFVSAVNVGAPGTPGTLDYRWIVGLMIGSAEGTPDFFLGIPTLTIVPPYAAIYGSEIFTGTTANQTFVGAIVAKGNPHQNSYAGGILHRLGLTGGTTSPYVFPLG
jgi:hypothetical protein